MTWLRFVTALAAFVLLTTVTECAIPRTQILVWVWSDLGSGGSLAISKLSVQVTSARGSELSRVFVLGTDDGTGHIPRVPGVIVVVYPRDNDAATEIQVDVTPRSSDDVPITPVSHHVVRFRPGHTDVLPVYLLAACRGAPCAGADSTCTLRGECQSAHETLTDYRGTFPVPYDPTLDAGTGFCDAGLSNCSGVCVDLPSNVDHCGSCTIRCGAGMTCMGGSCRCPPGLIACHGGCMDGQGDNANCGACGNVCMDSYNCMAGLCVFCGAGRSFCSSSDAGCYDLTSDVDNCGVCHLACNAMGATCTNGACHCPSGATCAHDQYCCGSTCCTPPSRDS